MRGSSGHREMTFVVKATASRAATAVYSVETTGLFTHHQTGCYYGAQSPVSPLSPGDVPDMLITGGLSDLYLALPLLESSRPFR